MGNIFANVKEFYIFTFISIIRFERKFIEVNSVKSINNWIYFSFFALKVTSTKKH